MFSIPVDPEVSAFNTQMRNLIDQTGAATYTLSYRQHDGHKLTVAETRLEDMSNAPLMAMMFLHELTVFCSAYDIPCDLERCELSSRPTDR